MNSVDTMAVPRVMKAGGEETGLQSPPETNSKDAPSDSDLSDLDPTEQHTDELHDLQPDHYSPDGSVPVFTPTMEEFKDFQRYVCTYRFQFP